MTSSNNTAENFLIERGIAKKPSVHRQQMLGCVACTWKRTGEDNPLNAKVSAQDIIPCRKLYSTIVSGFFSMLETASLVTRESEPQKRGKQGFGVLGGRPIQYFRPADTEAGLQFLDTLEPPESCPNDNK